MQQRVKAGFVLLLGVGSQGLPAAAQSPGTFIATGDMTTARGGHTATLLHNGKVLIAGGFVMVNHDPSGLATADCTIHPPAPGEGIDMVTVKLGGKKK